MKWSQCLIKDSFSSLADSGQWVGKPQSWNNLLVRLHCQKLEKLVVSCLNAGARSTVSVQQTKLYASKYELLHQLE